MPLNLESVSCVGLIVDSGGTTIGSGFVAQIANEVDPAQRHNYFVTAKHVVEDEEDVAIRFRRIDGEVETESALEWVHHPGFDVSAAPLPDRDNERVKVYALPTDSRVVQGDYLMPVLGTDVFYAGLFDPGKAMSTLGIPMVRSGTVAALYAPVERDDGGEPDILHLIDCRSYEGFSGSPCWVQFAYPGSRAPGEYLPPWVPDDDVEALELGSLYFQTVLFGMVIEHYNHRKAPAELASKVGIGLVLPVDCIQDILKHPDFVTQRSNDLAKRRPEGEPKREQLKSLPKRPEEFDAFEQLAKKLVNVTKDELDEKRNEKG